ncbi:hypothetical protein LR48_Vigan07g132600 [Vigna angularis]|uniref:MHD domain-containing protein n=1 Tax=Phaseolus angularis TaxID=3914 RepID=A0A0L9UYG5_PHAAN|nr:hypothetical protein LR48_Vigan07g132600 [Vigna angularis]
MSDPLMFSKDFGYVQTTSTEMLKAYVFNEPLVVDAARLSPLGPGSIFTQGTKRMPGIAVTKSVVSTEPGGRRREEIFVDIIEKISITFSSSGYILTSEIDGTIQMKSYLSGNPEIRLALNDDLSIGRNVGAAYGYRSSSGSGTVVLDDCNFHESVRLDSFDIDRTLSLIPPDGEFPVMNYRMTQEFRPPFRINALIEEAGSLKAEVILKISAEFASSVTANTIKLQMPLPKYTSRVSFELEPGAVGQTTDFKEANKRLEWSLKKIVGGSEHTLRAKLTFAQESHVNVTKESGPVSVTFTIPMYNASRLQWLKHTTGTKLPSLTDGGLEWLKATNCRDCHHWLMSSCPPNRCTVKMVILQSFGSGPSLLPTVRPGCSLPPTIWPGRSLPPTVRSGRSPLSTVWPGRSPLCTVRPYLSMPSTVRPLRSIPFGLTSLLPFFSFSLPPTLYPNMFILRSL